VHLLLTKGSVWFLHRESFVPSSLGVKRYGADLNPIRGCVPSMPCAILTNVLEIEADVLRELFLTLYEKRAEAQAWKYEHLAKYTCLLSNIN
jgi:hypothetical protein